MNVLIQDKEARTKECPYVNRSCHGSDCLAWAWKNAEEAEKLNRRGWGVCMRFALEVNPPVIAPNPRGEGKIMVPHVTAGRRN